MEAAMILCGALTVAAAIGVVFSQKSLHSALWLIVVLVLIGGHFALLGAEFLALLQILIYAGAVMVLIVFVVMLLGVDEAVEWKGLRLPCYLGAALGGALVGFIVVFGLSGRVFNLPEASGKIAFAGTAAAIGEELFGRYFYPFQIVGVLLLAAVIGAVVLAQEKKRPLAPGRGLRAVQDASRREQDYREEGGQ